MMRSRTALAETGVVDMVAGVLVEAVVVLVASVLALGILMFWPEVVVSA